MSGRLFFISLYLAYMPFFLNSFNTFLKPVLWSCCCCYHSVIFINHIIYYLFRLYHRSRQILQKFPSIYNILYLNLGCAIIFLLPLVCLLCNFRLLVLVPVPCPLLRLMFYRYWFYRHYHILSHKDLWHQFPHHHVST